MPVADEEAALQAISALATLSNEQKTAQSRIQTLLALDEPFVDIHELFAHYNTLYFRSLLLPRVELSWSPRLTLCAGTCELVRDPRNNNNNRYTRVRLKLSESLLKYRPRSDVLNTLLHEAIHAYFFLTTSWRHSRGGTNNTNNNGDNAGEDDDDDGTGHGAGFLLLADAINDHGGHGISVFHTFHDEVDSYRTHVWECDGPCRQRGPFFGLVKRSMNRAPGKSDVWWERHSRECGGVFAKVAEPGLSKGQLERMGGWARAGRQSNKIDGYVQKGNGGLALTSIGLKRSPVEADDAGGPGTKRLREAVTCPICDHEVPADAINAHIDQEHPP